MYTYLLVHLLRQRVAPLSERKNTRSPFLLLFISRKSQQRVKESRIFALFYERVKSSEKNVAKCAFVGAFHRAPVVKTPATS